MCHEIWKNIKGFNGDYQVSNFGHVKSVGRYVKHSDYGHMVCEYHRGRILSPCNKKGNYKQVHLSDRNHRHHDYQIHRLVANAFIPNPHHLPEVNHKDENPANNRVSNLEWCSRKYNCKYGNRTLKYFLSSIKKHKYNINIKLLSNHDSLIMKKIIYLICNLNCIK